MEILTVNDVKSCTTKQKSFQNTVIPSCSCCCCLLHTLIFVYLHFCFVLMCFLFAFCFARTWRVWVISMPFTGIQSYTSRQNDCWKKNVAMEIIQLLAQRKLFLHVWKQQQHYNHTAPSKQEGSASDPVSYACSTFLPRFSSFLPHILSFVDDSWICVCLCVCLCARACLCVCLSMNCWPVYGAFLHFTHRMLGNTSAILCDNETSDGQTDRWT